MNYKIKSVMLKADKDQVFDFLSKEENLPKWATVFCQSIRSDQRGYKVVTPSGEMYFLIKSDKPTGVLDMYVGPKPEQMICFPARIVEAEKGNSVFMFTTFQTPGMSIEEFQMQCQSLDEEFENIRRFTENNAR